MLGEYTVPNPAEARPYTPIVIDFQPFAIDNNDVPITQDDSKGCTSKYHLRITAPRSNRHGARQYVADSIYIDIPQDKPLRFKLIPSDRYLPVGRYKVEYFRKGKSTPLDTQEWIVPSLPLLNSYSFLLTETDPLLPLNIWKIVSVSPGDAWKAQYNQLIWYAETRPPTGTQITLKYEPAATLDLLINYRQFKLDSVERERL